MIKSKLTVYYCLNHDASYIVVKDPGRNFIVLGGILYYAKLSGGSLKVCGNLIVTNIFFPFVKLYLPCAYLLCCASLHTNAMPEQRQKIIYCPLEL